MVCRRTSFFVKEKSQKTLGKVFSQKNPKKKSQNYLELFKSPKKIPEKSQKRVKYFVSLIKSQKSPRKIPAKILEETYESTIIFWDFGILVGLLNNPKITFGLFSDFSGIF